MDDPARATLELVPCNLCGADDFKVLYNSPFRISESQDAAAFIASTDRYDRYGQIVRCRVCGLVYTNPRPLPQRIVGGYAASVDEDYAREDASRSINAHMALSVIKKFVKGHRLLDVGCSTGYFLNAARLDFDVTGVEPSRWAAAYARDRLHLNVTEGILGEASFPPESFDVITLNDVIEHVTNPLGLLKKVNSLLKPQGFLYLVTPNIQSFSARLLRGKWWGFRPAHLYCYSPKTLTALLNKAGFQVIFQRSYGRIFTYGYWQNRLKNYPRLISWAAQNVIRLGGWEDKFLYLDTRDSMQVGARKA